MLLMLMDSGVGLSIMGWFECMSRFLFAQRKNCYINSCNMEYDGEDTYEFELYIYSFQPLSMQSTLDFVNLSVPGKKLTKLMVTKSNVDSIGFNSIQPLIGKS